MKLQHSEDRVGAQLGQSWSTVRIELEYIQNIVRIEFGAQPGVDNLFIIFNNQGVMTRAINWKQLHEQYENNPDYKNKVNCSFI